MSYNTYQGCPNQGLTNKFPNKFSYLLNANLEGIHNKFPLLCIIKYTLRGIEDIDTIYLSKYSAFDFWETI